MTEAWNDKTPQSIWESMTDLPTPAKSFFNVWKWKYDPAMVETALGIALRKLDQGLLKNNPNSEGVAMYATGCMKRIKEDQESELQPEPPSQPSQPLSPTKE